MSAFLCMSEAEMIIKSLEAHRRETHADLSGLRSATSEMAAAVARLTTTVARVEERHARQDDGIKRLGAHVDDHEVRIRSLEYLPAQVSAMSTHEARIVALEIHDAKQGGYIGGGWKVITIVGACAMALVAIGGLAVKLLWP